MNTVSRFVIPNPKVRIINVRTCFASPYDMNCPLAMRAHNPHAKEIVQYGITSHEHVRSSGKGGLVGSCHRVGRGMCSVVAGSNPTHALSVENVVEQKLLCSLIIINYN